MPVVDADFAISWMRSRIDHQFRVEILDQHLKQQQKANKDVIEAFSKSAPRPNAATRYFADLLQPAFDFGRTVFLVTAHWGDYFQSLITLAAAFPDDSRFVTVRGMIWNDVDENKLWATLNGASNRHVEVFNQHDLKPIKLVREIVGGAHVFVLYDVDRSYGRPLVVDFFDVQLTLGAGWVDLAYRFDAIVVCLDPLTMFGDTMQLHSLYDARKATNIEAFRDACASMISDHLQSLVSKQPTLWFKWPAFNRFLDVR